ncbi:MAG TPA: hypothetical protein VES42_07605 [Pilimelia sp.]|nr:hypothetical protein [Pilimelia sp.]
MSDTERQVNHLRQAMRAETNDLPMHIPMGRIHRRSRDLRAFRRATVAAGLVLATVGAVPAYGYLGGGRPPGGAAQSADGPGRGCGRVTPVPVWPPDSSTGPLLETGTAFTAFTGQRRGVVIAPGTTGSRNAVFIAFQWPPGSVEPIYLLPLPPVAGGLFTAKGQRWPFESRQLRLSRDRVLDVGVYSGRAHRISVSSDGRAATARLSTGSAGTTIFWIERAGGPLPTNSERLTITAYDAAGRTLHTATGDSHTGIRVLDPYGSPPASRVPPCKR